MELLPTPCAHGRGNGVERGKGGVREHDTPTRLRADLSMSPPCVGKHERTNELDGRCGYCRRRDGHRCRCEGLVDVHDGQPHGMGMRVDSARQANGRLVGHAVLTQIFGAPLTYIVQYGT
jgi:hypothetical protein